MKEITVTELKAKLNAKEDFLFLDVREPYEYAEYNMNAKNIPLGSLGAVLGDLEEHKNSEIVVHCRSGARSAAAQQILLAQGFTNVANLTGGALAYQEKFG